MKRKIRKSSAVIIGILTPVKLIAVTIIVSICVLFYSFFWGVNGIYGYTNEKVFHHRHLSAHLVPDLPKPQGEFIKTNSGDRGHAEIKLTQEEYHAYAETVYAYLVSRDYKFLGTEGWKMSTLTPRYIAVEALEFGDFCHDGSYSFVWANKFEKNSAERGLHYLKIEYSVLYGTMVFCLCDNRFARHYVYDFFNSGRLSHWKVSELPQPEKEGFGDLGYKINYSMTEKEFNGYLGKVYGYFDRTFKSYNRKFGPRRDAAESSEDIEYEIGDYTELADFKTSKVAQEYLFVWSVGDWYATSDASQDGVRAVELFVRYRNGIMELEMRNKEVHYAVPEEAGEVTEE